MGRDVNHTASGPAFTQNVCARLLSHKNFCLIEHAGQSLNLIQDGRRLRVGMPSSSAGPAEFAVRS